MKAKVFFNIASKVCFVLFIIVSLLLIYAVLEFIARIGFPNSSFSHSFGALEPIFSYFNFHFNKTPELYTEKSFILLALMTNIGVALFGLIILWLIRKLFINLYNDKFFTFKNARIIQYLGINSIVLGSTFTYIEELTVKKVIPYLDITNATFSFSSIYYLDVFLNGIILILISYGMKVAVRAIEENEQTI